MSSSLHIKNSRSKLAGTSNGPTCNWMPLSGLGRAANGGGAWRSRLARAATLATAPCSGAPSSIHCRMNFSSPSVSGSMPSGISEP